MKQNNLDGEEVRVFATCARCGRELRAAQSVFAGYGHACAQTVFLARLREERLRDAEEREWLEAEKRFEEAGGDLHEHPFDDAHDARVQEAMEAMEKDNERICREAETER